MKKISVITTFYNSESTIKSAVDSILNQSFSNFEYILVDDGSTDNSVDVINKFVDSRITLLKPGRVGRAEALNLGLQNSSGDYIAILDADDIVLDERFSIQQELLNNNPDVVLVSSNAELINEQGKVIGKTNFPTSHDELVSTLIKLNPFPHSSVMYRRDNALKIQGYNLRCEKSIDYNFYLELLLAGGKFINVDKPLIRLRSYSSSWGKNDRFGLQIRYGIIGLINYFEIKEGKKGFLRVEDSVWLEFKETFDAWFEQRRFHKKMDAKKYFSNAGISIKNGDLKEAIFSFFKTIRLDPWFWSYRGCGFNEHNDIKEFVMFFHKEKENRV